jgi:hypothetical protein
MTKPTLEETLKLVNDITDWKRVNKQVDHEFGFTRYNGTIEPNKKVSIINSYDLRKKEKFCSVRINDIELVKVDVSNPNEQGQMVLSAYHQAERTYLNLKKIKLY